jgi:hypothetical protein
VIAAVAVSGPAFRFRSDRLEQIATAVVEAAEALSARNGFVRLADPPTAGVERARTP